MGRRPLTLVATVPAATLLLTMVGAPQPIAPAGAAPQQSSVHQTEAMRISTERGAATAAARERRCPTPRSAVLRTTPATYRKTVALTFDDGPTMYTTQILEILEQHQVRATFFVTGEAVDANPDMVREVSEAGMPIGNHTYTHPQAVAGSPVYGRFHGLPARVQAREIDRTTTALVAATGKRPCAFRAPGGWDKTATTVRLNRARGMNVVNWSVSSGDSGQPARTTTAATRAIVANSTRNPGSHPILLMHDGKASPEPERLVTRNRGNTVAALPRIIRWYQARGYVFTNVLGRRL